jgi:hypothetical protein
MTGGVFLLVGSDSYYPSHDNTLIAFRRKRVADQILQEIENAKHWDASEGDWERVVERYPWLPEHKFDRYTVEEHRLIGTNALER